MAAIAIDESTTPADVAEEDVEELRLAIVMSGGVSLAVWMGGVATEISHLVRGSGVYAELLALTASRARADVIAGTSAGGINGALLAVATAHDTDLDIMRELWLDKGSLTAMLRDPLQPNPPSLLQGDKYFLPSLQEAIATLARGRLVDPETQPVQLLITTTLLEGETRALEDDRGVLVHDVDHRGLFQFGRGPGRPDDFAREELNAQLALACRSTASFPVAFEPSLCPVGPDAASDGHPDMTACADFTGTHYVIDGGVLDNRPFGPALHAILEQPAQHQTRRVLAYVTPDPDPVQPDVIKQLQTPPTLAKVALECLVVLPRGQSVGRELEDIKAHNRKVQLQRDQRASVLQIPDLTTAAGDLLRAYAMRRVSAWVNSAIEEMNQRRQDPRGAGGAGPVAGGAGRVVPATSRRSLEQVRGALTDAWSARLEEQLRVVPAGTLPATVWGWSPGAVERVASVVLDLVRQGLHVASPAEASLAGARRTLRQGKAALHRVFAALRGIRSEEMAFWREQAERAATAGELPAWAQDAIAHRPVERSTARLVAEAETVARVFLAVEPALRAAAGATPGDGTDRTPGTPAVNRSQAAEALLGTVTSLAGPPGERTPQDCAQRLLALEVLERALNGADPVPEQSLELVQVSANAANGFDQRAKPSDKLTGLQLAHFSAFYKRSWRANDWMWGRLDGAAHLAEVVLNPARMRQLALSSQEAADALERIALGPEGDARDALQRAPGGWDRQRALEELAFLDQPEDATMPKRLPVCSRAVASRIQLEILGEELLEVADAAEGDMAEGAATTLAAKRLVRKAGKAGRPLPPQQAVDLFTDCAVSTEKLAGEVGSDLFTTTVTSAALLAASTTAGSTSGLPRLRPVTLALRAFALSFYWVGRGAVSKGRSGFALTTLALAVAGALLATGLLSGHMPGMLLGFAGVLVAAGLALLVVRGARLQFLTAAAVIVAGIVLAILLGPKPLWSHARADLGPLLPVALIIVGGLIPVAGGLLHRPPAKAPRARTAAPAGKGRNAFL